MMHYVYAPKYGYTDSKADYPKITNLLIELVEDNCFSVWLRRIIYNYYLDCIEYDDEVQNDLELLEPPSDKRYIKMFSSDVEIESFMFGKDEGYKPYEFTYEKHVFVKVPVEEPWKVLAWIPMGGSNWCPDELHQIALARELYERYGARLMYISSSTLEYYIPEPLTSKDEFEKAARILIEADNDVYEDYEVAARRVLGSHNWIMWWD